MVTAEAPLICVIDDDPSIREALVSLLSSAELRVEAFASAEAFLSHAPFERVGCLILDVQLPGMSGLALQRTLIERQVSIRSSSTPGTTTTHSRRRPSMMGRSHG